MKALYVVVFSLFCIGPLRAQYAEGLKELNEFETESLVAFAKLYGLVRFFHPSDQALKTDWDSFAVEGVRRIECVKDSGDLIIELRKLFTSVAPSIQIGRSDELNPVGADYYRTYGDLKRMRYWHHVGYGETGFKGVGKLYWELLNAYRSDVEERRADRIDSLIRSRIIQCYDAELFDSIRVIMPVGVYVKDGRTVPIVRPEEKSKSHISRYSDTDDRSVRIAIVIYAWNVLKYFYPYWDVIESDWNNELEEALKNCSTDSSREEFERTLQAMIAKIEDGHAHIRSYPIRSFGYYGSFPVDIRWIENEVVVTYSRYPDSLGIEVGDIVRSIEGRDVLSLIEDHEELSSAARPESRRSHTIYEMMASTLDSIVMVEFEKPDGSLHEVSISREEYINTGKEKEEKIVALEDSILYVKLEGMRRREFKRSLPKLRQASGLIFDVRCYPHLGPWFLGYLSNTDMLSPIWNVPVLVDPNVDGVRLYDKDQWRVKSRRRHLSCPMVFIIDEEEISYAETLLGIIEAYKLGEIVGSPTAGTNGNVQWVVLSPGMGLIYTGMQVLKQDGSRHHGVGIHPTVPCSPTIEGIRSGRDELLERAIEVVRSKITTED